LDKDKIRQKIQEEIAKLSEEDRKGFNERWDKLREGIKSPEEMLAEIDARCKVLKESGQYDANKIEIDLREKMIESNKRVDLLRGRSSK
jgi:hypothetical protein